MATGQELATAYLSLTVSARGINKDIQREMSGAEGIAEKTGRSMGSKLASGIKTGAKVAGVAVAALLGTALTKGFGRLSAIENAQASLSGLGNSAEDVSAIMKNALAAVKGTAFGMDEAASTAAGAVAAGIKPGEDLEKVLRLVGDAATIGGSSMGEMGAIFNKVATSNKVQGDVIAQLNDRGIPIVQLLGKQLGVTSEEVTKMAAKGEIGFDTFRAAMEEGLGGAALKSGETTKGAFKNMMAALSRIGAGLLGGVFPYFKTVFGGITKLLDGLESKLTPLANAFGKELAGGIMAFGAAWKANDGDITSSGFAGVMERLAYIGRQAFDGLSASITAFRNAWIYNDGEVTSSGLPGVMERLGYIAHQVFDELRGSVIAFGAAWRYNDGEVTSSGLPGFMERLGYGARQAFDTMKYGITAFTNAWKYNDGEITSSGFSGFMEHAGYVARQAVEAVGKLDFRSWHGFTGSLSTAGGTIGSALGPALSSMGESLKSLAPAAKEFAAQMPNVGGAVAKLAAGGLTVITKVLGFLADHVDTIIFLMPLIVAGFIAWRIATLALASGTYAMQAAQLAMTPVITLNNILRLTAIRLENQQTAASARNTLAQGAQTTALNVGAAAQTRTTLATKALGLATGQYSVKMVASAIATKAHAAATATWSAIAKGAAAAQRVLNLALKANPIGLIITGITALVAGLVWFFTQTETGQKIIAGAWAGIKTAVSAVSDWFTGTLLPGIAAVWEGISAGAMWLLNNGIKPAWDGIKAAVGAVIGWFQGTVLPIVQSVFAAVGAVFSWLYTTIIQPVFSAISTVVGGFYLLARGIFQLVVSVIVNVLAPAFTSFWRGTIQPVFDAIGGKFSSWWNGAKAIFTTVVTFLRTTLSAAFTWLRDTVIAPVFDAIQTKVTSWWSGAKAIFDAVIGFIRGALSTAFTWFRDSVISPVLNGIKTTVTTWWNDTKAVFDAVIGFIRNTLSAAFTWLRDNVISPVWNGIIDIISGVWNNGVKPVFEALRGFIMDTIPDAFRTGVDAVKTAWEKLKDIAKAPVKFVVDTVINGGLIAAFNKIAGVLPGIDKLPNVALPAGFARGGILPGYESRKRDTVLTPMRPGEGVLVPEVIRGAGRGLIDTLNAAGNRGVGAVRRLMANGLHPGRATGGLIHPIPGFGINSGFGRNGTDPSHTGADFAAPTGTPVRAAGPGVVTQAAWSNYGGGNEVKVNHPNGLQTWYSHLSSILARLGQTVMAGQTVGRVGSTGNSTGPHLHYTVMRDGRYVDPAGYLAGGGAGGTSGSGGAAPTNPLENALDGLVSKFKDKFPGGGMFADLAIGTGKKIFTDAKDWVTEKLGGIKDTIKNVVAGAGRLVGIGNAGAPTVYDGGGWLEKTGAPQLVHHRKSKPDAVLSNEQWGTMTRIAENSRGSGHETHIHVENMFGTADQIADDLSTKQQRAITMHNLRKVMVG